MGIHVLPNAVESLLTKPFKIHVVNGPLSSQFHFPVYFLLDIDFTVGNILWMPFPNILEFMTEK